jgi:hypothetical protein
MIKKQLGLLAGSVMLASSANAAITLDGNTLAVFNTAGAGSYYQLVAGSTGDTLAARQPFSVDISAAAAALGGSIDSLAVFALASTQCSSAIYPCYNYTEFLYVSEGGGLVYAGDTATSTTNLAAVNEIFGINAFLAYANLGFNGEGTLGDFDSNAQVAGYLNSGSSVDINGSNMSAHGASVIFNQQTLTGATNAQLITLTSLPIPTTAWLFGSALAGLLVAKKKHKNSID